MIMVARDGIEPPTQAFSGLCSTDWATWPLTIEKAIQRYLSIILSKINILNTGFGVNDLLRSTAFIVSPKKWMQMDSLRIALQAMLRSFRGCLSILNLNLLESLNTYRNLTSYV